ncbi:hypothetical protein BBJ29_001023 [Phytophthora kernoviae]|uniref:Crossover junction endonuclease MUS81-like HHH domain-containing protein n=1 Tax=Phytophthora kernoviae TaxID=325452 RepID=A0A3F2S2Y9_9STRA|nr:hypothetical protein BBJ29_001023 [Phytophthora kernoviae]RLN69276.1 hypothetical protein BBP00_00000484 [Phytophthora kernoviae]
MNSKQANEVLSDLLMKCDEQGIQLPENPWMALREAIIALRDAVDQEVQCLEMEKALEQLKIKYGTSAQDAEAAATSTPRLARRQKRTLMQDLPKRKRSSLVLESDSDEDFGGQTGATVDVLSPVASSKKNVKKSRIHEQVQETPAARAENQTLVNQLVELGQFEMRHGHTQRGLARLRAAMQIRDARMVVTSGAQAKKLERVGPSVATKVDQLLNEGLEAALREYDEDDEAMAVAK